MSSSVRRARRMLVLCPYPEGVAAGQRLKFEQYYPEWRRDGWEITVSPYMGMKLWSVLWQHGRLGKKVFEVLRGLPRRFRDLFRIRRFDLVYCHMYVTPLGTPLFEWLTRTLARKLVYDVEDNVLVGQQLEPGQNPNPLVGLLRGRRKMEYLIRKADHVITSSPSLNETCLEMNEKRACTYISSSVDTDRFIPVNEYKNGGPVTIGWTGTFSTRPFLDLLRPVFEELAKRRVFRLRVIGNFDYELPGIDLEVVRWTAEREVEDLQAIDVGVYPLPVDGWVTGKSGLKAIQYMAFALPCVATNVGTTPRIIRNRENGLLVRTPEEWLSALEELIDNPALRRQLGQQARQDAVEKYSTKAVAAEYRGVLASVMES